MDDTTLVDNEAVRPAPAGDGPVDAACSDETVDMFLYLTFLLGQDLFGIPVKSIREVIEYKKVFKTPRVPDYIKGVINLRGEVVPIIDLSCRFYRKKSKMLETTAIVVVEVSEDKPKIPIGVMIDSVRSVAELRSESIESTPEIGTRIRSDFLEGIGKANDEFIILLNIQSILNIEELSAIEDKIN